MKDRNLENRNGDEERRGQERICRIMSKKKNNSVKYGKWFSVHQCMRGESEDSMGFCIKQESLRSPSRLLIRK